MKRWFSVRWLLAVGILMPLIAGCGGSDGEDGASFVRPGLVGIEDRPAVAVTAPELTIEYLLPGVPGILLSSLLSDQPSDGDIAYDPTLDAFTITQGPDRLLFGRDSSSPHRPEYRAFLDFPLDGSTGEAVIPLEATIVSAKLTVFVQSVDFAASVPVLLDLIAYPVVSGLSPADYSSPPLAVRSFTIFHTDAGRDLQIDVTSLMAEVQRRALADFQVRFLLAP